MTGSHRSFLPSRTRRGRAARASTTTGGSRSSPEADRLTGTSKCAEASSQSCPVPVLSGVLAECPSSSHSLREKAVRCPLRAALRAPVLRTERERQRRGEREGEKKGKSQPRSAAEDMTLHGLLQIFCSPSKTRCC